MGNSQSGRLASSAHRRVSHSSHMLLTALPFQINRHLLFPLVPCIVGCCCLSSYFCCHCLCMLLNLFTQQVLPISGLSFVSLLVAVLPAEVSRFGRRGEGLHSRVTVERYWAALPHELFWRGGEALLHSTAQQLCSVACIICTGHTVPPSEVCSFFLWALMPLSFWMHWLPGLPSSVLSVWFPTPLQYW